MKDVIGYVRVSTKEQGQKHSLGNQRASIESYCQEVGWNLVDLIQDCESGASMNRTGIIALKEIIQGINIDGIVIWKLDRLSRSLVEGKMFLTSLEDNNIFLKSLSEPLIDTSTPLGSMILNLLFTFAEFERELMKERINGGKARAFSKGLRPHGRIPMGYYRDTAGNLDIDPNTADIVHQVFSLRAKHLSYRKIFQKLDTLLSSQNLPNPVASHVSIGNIIKNRTYVGEVKYGGEWRKGSHQPIVSKRLFNCVQAKCL